MTISPVLPAELMVKVFSHLDPNSLHACGFVSRFWHHTALDNNLWESLYKKKFIRGNATINDWKQAYCIHAKLNFMRRTVGLDTYLNSTVPSKVEHFKFYGLGWDGSITAVSFLARKVLLTDNDPLLVNVLLLVATVAVRILIDLNEEPPELKLVPAPKDFIPFGPNQEILRESVNSTIENFKFLLFFAEKVSSSGLNLLGIIKIMEGSSYLGMTLIISSFSLTIFSKTSLRKIL